MFLIESSFLKNCLNRQFLEEERTEAEQRFCSKIISVYFKLLPFFQGASAHGETFVCDVEAGEVAPPSERDRRPLTRL